MSYQDFDIDDILNEFTASSESRTDSADRNSAGRKAAPAPQQRRRSAEPEENFPYEEDFCYSPERGDSIPRNGQPDRVSRSRRQYEEDDSAPRRSRGVSGRIPEREAFREDEPDWEEDAPQTSSGRAEGRKTSFLGTLLAGVVFLGILAAVSFWMLRSIRPATPVKSADTVKSDANLSERFVSLVNNVESDAMSDIVYIRKVWSIPENATVAPKPSSVCFGETTDPAVVQAVIDGASELLDGQSTVWNPSITLYDNSTIQYYCDDTILSIVWKEPIGNTVFTFAEVKIADGSQLRRCLAGDEYSSSIQLRASDMASTVNAVTAMNGDFYAFRQVGVVVYKRRLERFEPSTLDSCFFTSSGDMLFSHRGELTSAEETERFIADNDVLFSTSFGPILVENGELYSTSSYPVGEIFNKYARSAIGMTGDKHYLLMATSSEDDGRYLAGVYVSEAGRIMYDKGCTKAYELDGGQTAVIIHNNVPANEIVYGSERTMSDILYFATAIPEEEARK